MSMYFTMALCLSLKSLSYSFNTQIVYLLAMALCFSVHNLPFSFCIYRQSVHRYSLIFLCAQYIKFLSVFLHCDCLHYYTLPLCLSVHRLSIFFLQSIVIVYVTLQFIILLLSVGPFQEQFQSLSTLIHLLLTCSSSLSLSLSLSLSFSLFLCVSHGMKVR